MITNQIKSADSSIKSLRFFLIRLNQRYGGLVEHLLNPLKHQSFFQIQLLNFYVIRHSPLTFSIEQKKE